MISLLINSVLLSVTRISVIRIVLSSDHKVLYMRKKQFNGVLG